MGRPPTTDDAILHNLPIADVVRFGWLCKATQFKVQSYIFRHFQLSVLLGRFFNTFDLSSFRALMATTQLLIGGSIPLQFFVREIWYGSDMDLYVDLNFAHLVGEWLLGHGFSYKPSKQQPLPPGLPIRSNANTSSSSQLVVQPSTITRYDDGKAVYNFVHRQTHRVVQLVACFGTPLQTILKFHSSTSLLTVTA